MARTVFNNHELFHIWASQSQESGRNSNNSISFNGPVLFSYHQPIARIVNGGVVHVIGYWSVTTGRHQSAARSATHHMTTVHAHDVGRYELDHNRNKQLWGAAFASVIEQLQRHPRRKKSLTRDLAHINEQRTTYSKFFKLDWEPLNLEEVAKEVEQAAIAARELRARAEEELRQKRIRLEQEQAEELAKWRKHEPCKYNYFAQTALRLSKTGNEIETSRGARVPVRIAARLWTAIKSCREHNKSWVPPVTFAVGVYKLTRIEKTGDIVVGCHNIPYVELALIAEELGYEKEPAHA